MIALVLSMLWSRRGQAVTLALLAMFSVSAAVAAPAYLRAADRAGTAGQVADAGPAERGVVLSQVLPDRRGADPLDPAQQSVQSLTETGGSLTGLPGFDYVYAAEFPTLGLEPDTVTPTTLVDRQDVCAHLTIVAGRCLAGESDVVIGAPTAARLHLNAGDAVRLAYAKYVPDPAGPGYEVDGDAKTFLVAGTYRATDPTAAYWGTSGYFGGVSREPAFVDAASYQAMDHGISRMSLAGYAGPGALGVDDLPRLRAGLARLRTTVRTLGVPVTLDTGLPTLLGRIDTGRAAAHLIVPVPAVALILLACATIFLAVGYGTEGRRPELAVVALRGARWGQRWWLATGENLLAIVAGALAGCVAGQLLVDAVAAALFPGVGADAALSSLRYAPAALLAALLTALLAERRQLGLPVTDLLRRAPGVPREAAAIAFTAAVALLAAVAGTQLRITGGTLTGVGTFAAALILSALAQLTARALLPFATRYARRALRRGRLGPALAGFQLSRRPGAARLFALLIAAVAVAGYAACAVDVAAQGRDVQAELGTGAPTVIGLGPVNRQHLLTAVRAVDPGGTYAMAVVRLPTAKNEPPGLAVDSTRLATVGFWPGDGPARAAAARALRPPAAAPVTISGADFSLDVTATGLQAGKPVGIGAVLSSSTGLGDALVPLGAVRTGRHAYRARVPVCRAGCRLNALRVSEGDGALDVTGRLILHAVGPPATPAVPLNPAAWRVTAGGTVEATPGGLQIDLAALNALPAGLLVQPADTPDPMPVGAAGPGDIRTVAGLDGRNVPVTAAFTLSAVPGAGTRATLIDLEYADRLTVDGDRTGLAQVWLSAQAPPGTVPALAAHGLPIVSETRAADVHRGLDGQSPALALGFYVIIGCLAVGLAAGALVLAAVVDRARRGEDLSALRAQGLGRAALRQAALWTYPVLVGGAVVAGLGVGLVTWWLTGWALPLAGLRPPALPLPGWPRPGVLGVAGAAVLGVLAGVAYLAGRRTLRAAGPRGSRPGG